MIAARHTLRGLHRISDLARETGVPVGTIKFYIREGLLPEPTVKTGRNMAYYDHSFVDRIRCIRELQQKRFLPLEVIRAILDGNTDVISPQEVATLLGLEGKFYEAILHGPSAPPIACVDVETRYGLAPSDVAVCVDLGLVQAVDRGNGDQFEGDDALLLECLSAVRSAGFDDALIPAKTALPMYVRALDELAAQELRVFSRGVAGKVGEARAAELALAGVRVVEQLLVLMRRKRLLRALQTLREEQSRASTGTDD
jgi:DNA-binding transcriptional MerR regulator